MLVKNTLNNCRYCDTTALQYVVEVVNAKGQYGFKSVCYCPLCHASVEWFHMNMHEAIKRAASCWNRGILEKKE